MYICVCVCVCLSIYIYMCMYVYIYVGTCCIDVKIMAWSRSWTSKESHYFILPNKIGLKAVLGYKISRYDGCASVIKEPLDVNVKFFI
jgi:hypothetical protein